MTDENIINGNNTVKRQPGVCISWEEVKERYGEILGNEEQIKRIWTENDAEAYDYYWQCLLSF
ncbi:hypothetical protein FACS189427_00820 [Planctomycetales bacterium]|nr:hypothetical protein FACS189427_00820 [Planctomycetales bacterium]